jgi:hypothetical protein
VDSKGLEALRAELLLARPPLAGIAEGLRHMLGQADLLPEVRVEVEALLAGYQRRETLMLDVDARASGTLDAVQSLLFDGFPVLPERDINPEAFDALDQNRRSIELAQAQFRPRAITTEGTSEVGPEEPQP